MLVREGGRSDAAALLRTMADRRINALEPLDEIERWVGTKAGETLTQRGHPMRLERDLDFRQAERIGRMPDRPRVAVARLEGEGKTDAQWMWDLISAAGAVVVLMASISLALASF